MKLTTWNCTRGFEQKKQFFFDTQPDIAVIQECSKKSTESLAFDRYHAFWVGANPNIGMGVFYKKADWDIGKLEALPNSIEWVVPFEVTGLQNFTLIAVWACQIERNKRDSYVGQINRALQEHPGWFANGPVVVAGDFNSNACWDKERRNWNRSTMVAELKRHGLTSVYHDLKAEKYGEETTPTFHLQKNREKPFHIDYIFAPDAWQGRMEMTIGDCSEWLEHSDHCPLTLSLY